jgi:GNAT superfamily N-acetyltransferase
MFRFGILDESHRDKIVDFYLGLDEESRHQRFFGPIGEDALRRHVKGLDFDRSSVIGVWAGADLVGVAEAPMTEDSNGEPAAELAIALTERARGFGVGGTLFWYAMSAARERGAHHIEVITAHDNQPMQRMALRAGLKGSRLNGDWHGEFELSEEASHLPSVHWLLGEEAANDPSNDPPNDHIGDRTAPARARPRAA